MDARERYRVTTRLLALVIGVSQSPCLQSVITWKR